MTDDQPDDMELVISPIADYRTKVVPRFVADAMKSLAGDYTLVWRACASLCAENWPACDQVLAETGLDGRGFDLFKVAVHEASKIALLAAGNDHQLAEEHFLRLIQAQQLIDEGK